MNALKTLYQNIVTQLGWSPVNLSELKTERLRSDINGINFTNKTQGATFLFISDSCLHVICKEKAAENGTAMMHAYMFAHQKHFVFSGADRNDNFSSMKTIKLDITPEIFKPFGGY